MSRDREVKLLSRAGERLKKGLSSWLNDPRVKAILRRNHEQVRPRPKGRSTQARG